jgi:hypothetical protein
MKVIDLARKRPTLSQVLEMATGENLVLKTAHGKEFVLAEADDFGREIALVRQNRSLMKLLDARSKETKKYSLAEVKKRLKINGKRK